MSEKKMMSMSFDQLKDCKIRLRRRGLKGGVRYANIERVMKIRFGRT